MLHIDIAIKRLISASPPRNLTKNGVLPPDHAGEDTIETADVVVSCPTMPMALISPSVACYSRSKDFGFGTIYRVSTRKAPARPLRVWSSFEDNSFEEASSGNQTSFG